jgi:hypothetical protein
LRRRRRAEQSGALVRGIAERWCKRIIVGFDAVTLRMCEGNRFLQRRVQHTGLHDFSELYNEGTFSRRTGLASKYARTSIWKAER